MRPLLLLLPLLLLHCSLACLLCPLRVPPRPRPLDQFQRPSLPDWLGQSSEQQKPPQICAGSARLPLTGQCKTAFSDLLCSTERFLNSSVFGGCPSSGEECSECSLQKDKDKWVVNWLDALGKPPSGVSDGNYYWLGDYETCYDLSAKGAFDGKYCRVELEVPDSLVEAGCPQTDPLQIILGACLPAACPEQQLETIGTMVFPYKLRVDCELPKSPSFLFYVFTAIFVAWLLVLLGATVLHFKKRGPPRIYCLSLKRNLSEALSTKREHGTPHAHQGFEFVCFFFLISGSVYNYMLPYIENVAFSFDSVSNMLFLPVNHYSYFIDGLMALSAVFTTYLCYGQLKSFDDCLHAVWTRLVRFWPSYAASVIFMATAFPIAASGPMWIHGDTVSRCSSSWWKNLLFISNWFGAEDTCLDFGYVVSMEAQFFVLLVALVYFSRDHAERTKAAALAFIILSSLATFLRVYFYDLPPAAVLTVEPLEPEKLRLLLDSVLISSLTRCGPYLIGFLFAFHLYPHTNDDGEKLDKGTTLVVLTGVTVVIAFVAGGIYPWIARAEGARVYLSIYSAVYRPLFAAALLSLLWLCHNGGLAPLNTLLGWRVFSPLSKLTFLSLLLSEPIILYFFSSLNRPAHATHWSTMYAAISAGCLSYLCALLVDVTLGRPIRHILTYRDYTKVQRQ